MCEISHTERRTGRSREPSGLEPVRALDNAEPADNRPANGASFSSANKQSVPGGAGSREILEEETLKHHEEAAIF